MSNPKAVNRLVNLLNRQLFTTLGKLPHDRITEAFRLLACHIRAHGLEGGETDWDFPEFAEASLSDLIVGAYYFYSDYHAGQNSPEYAAQSALSRIYKPGPCSRGPEEDSQEQAVYAALENFRYFGTLQTVEEGL